jgi:hypothetical protein
MDKDQLLSDAEALERTAAAAEYLAGLAAEDDVNQSAVSAREEAGHLRRWAQLLRSVAESL